MEINQYLEQPEEKHTKETALFFLNNESEKNNQTAFLRYYGDERNKSEPE